MKSFKRVNRTFLFFRMTPKMVDVLLVSLASHPKMVPSKQDRQVRGMRGMLPAFRLRRRAADLWAQAKELQQQLQDVTRAAGLLGTGTFVSAWF